MNRKEYLKQWNREYGKTYRKKNASRISKYKKRYRKNNLEMIKKYHQQYNLQNKLKLEDGRLKRRFGISLEQVDSILIQQNHKCPICGKSLIETKRVVDHDHKNGNVRGILCVLCNVGLGSFRDDPRLLQNASKYLETTK